MARQLTVQPRVSGLQPTHHHIRRVSSLRVQSLRLLPAIQNVRQLRRTGQRRSSRDLISLGFIFSRHLMVRILWRAAPWREAFSGRRAVDLSSAGWKRQWYAFRHWSTP